MPPILAVLFDLDGVLIDSYDLWFHLLNQATAHFGFPPISPERFRPTWGQGVEADIDEFMPGTAMADVQRFFADHYADHVAHVRLEPGAREALAAVRRAPARPEQPRALGCVTNSPGLLARTVLSRVGLLEALDRVVGADEAGGSKPAPDGILLACRALGVDPDQTVMVGDASYDRDAARAAGVIFLGYRMPVPHRIDELEALPNWLSRFEHGESRR